MVIRATRFNTYLLFVVLLVSSNGCRTDEAKREKRVSTLRVHLEVSPDGLGQSERVPVFRAAPFMVNIDKEPFLTEANVTSAKVVETLGGFALQIRFDRRGTWLLEQYSSTASGRHFAIFSQFGAKFTQSRWLAAPLIARRISDGALLFTPDTTREETDEIVLGLNNVARQVQPGPVK